MTDERESDGVLDPEGVLDAAPAGGWESADVADTETAERNAGAQGSPDLTDSGLPPNMPEHRDATADGAQANDARTEGES